MKLSIVLPCYNEEENIPLILEQFKKCLSNEKIEVIVVDNGSTDNTKEVLNRLIPNYSFVELVNITVNKGYGYGILQGLKVARGEFVGWTHADLQTDPNDIIKAYKLLEANNWDKNIYVKGKRTGRKFIDNFCTSLMTIFETLYLKQKLYDINAQPNIFSKEFLLYWRNPPHDFLLDLYSTYIAMLYGLKMIRIKVSFPPRKYGASHSNTDSGARWRSLKETYKYSIELKKLEKLEKGSILEFNKFQK